MITMTQAEAIVSVANTGMTCIWTAEGYTFTVSPADGDEGQAIAYLGVRNPRNVSLLLTVLGVWIKGDELRISTADGFAVAIPIECEEAERMAGSDHIFGEDGYCIWCATPRDKVRTRSCPMCPYDDGLAYLEEVGEP